MGSLVVPDLWALAFLHRSDLRRNPRPPRQRVREPRRVKLSRSTMRILAIILAPFIIGWWCLCHPRKVWEQARKDLNF